MRWLQGKQGCPLRKGRKGTFIGEFKGVKEFVNQGTEIPESTGQGLGEMQVLKLDQGRRNTKLFGNRGEEPLEGPHFRTVESRGCTFAEAGGPDALWGRGAVGPAALSCSLKGRPRLWVAVVWGAMLQAGMPWVQRQSRVSAML